MMKRQQAVEIIARACGAGDLISVATMQVVPVWHACDTSDQHHVDALGCMGSASSLGLGLALGAPTRKVAVLDGDGSLMMQLGSLVTIGEHAPSNYYHFVFENRAYETSGNQPVPGTSRGSIRDLAVAAGYASAHVFGIAETFAAAIEDVLAEPGPVMIVLQVEREEACKSWPKLSMKNQVKMLKERLSADSG